MTTTGQNWIDDARAYLDGDRAEAFNTLAVAYEAGGDTLTLRSKLEGVVRGTVLSVGCNTLRVVEVPNTTLKTVKVIPGYLSSTDADADVGSLVRIMPRFSDHRILRSINAALRTLSAPAVGIYGVATQTLSVVCGTAAYEITPATGFQRVLEVRRLITDDASSYARVDAADWDVLRSSAADPFTSGVALRFRRHPGNVTVQVVFAKKFTPITDVTLDVSTTGISEDADDIPPIGGAIALVGSLEISRNATSTQGNARNAGEVPPGAIGNSYRGLERRWFQRTKEESDRLRSMYPVGA